MSIAPDCDRCGSELQVPGALIFGPPGLLATRAVEKFHVCFDYWPTIRETVQHFPAGRAAPSSYEVGHTADEHSEPGDSDRMHNGHNER